MPRLACLSFLFVTMVSGAAAAQGLYLPDRTSGIGVSAAASANDDATIFSVGAGYSWKAFLDGGAFVNRYGFSIDNPSVTAIGLQPYVNVHLLRQSDVMPFSVAATGNFQKYFYSTDASNRDIDGWSFLLGGSIYRRFAASETFSVTPQATLGYTFTHTRGAVGLIKLAPNDGSFLFQIAGNLAYQAGGGTIWALNPYMSVDANYVTFGAVFGPTFPIGR
jgi:hypothetical protein